MMTFLIILVVALAAVALVQIVRIFEVSNTLTPAKEEDNRPSHKDNDIQGKILFVLGMLFVVFSVWSIFKWGGYILPVSASEHGLETDRLLWITMAVIGFVFLITQPLLFWFVYRFRGIKGRKATYMEHNNKLELLWTSVPTVVLAIIITYGIITWGNIMNPEFEEEPIVVELYAKQFGWQARIAGEDNVLGNANVRFIEGINSIGIDPNDLNGLDDIVTSELMLPVGKPILFKFRAQDVIHSAYIPHFRLQMNCVPGTVTQFAFTPNKTTAEMRRDPKVIRQISGINEIREAKGEEPYEFDFVLLCNKICGAAHYNMQMKIVVGTEEEYNQWLKEQTTFAESL
ncbi:MAG: cytochrome c oxidase subunit II [Flavobacteriales bacterium]|nr:MAG: cytochrome c oxidase subunit II [Flavobacteriales bacterium]